MFSAQPSLAVEPSAASQQRLKELMQQRAGTAAPLDAARLAERTNLLGIGEAALARGQAEPAQRAFERAALMSHAADTEMGIVRAHMQAGEYRRALGFGAHTAGAHLDVAGGAALYAWLLHAGGQAVAATRLLDEVRARHPNHPVVEAARTQLQTAAPVATGLMLNAPVRLAPGGSGAVVAGGARSTGTALLFDRGRRALVPTVLITGGKALWLRNGVGVTVTARQERALPELGLTVLKLSAAMPPPAALSVAPRDAFAGSQGSVVSYAPSMDAEPRWPLLVSGFVGSPIQDASKTVIRSNQLGISSASAVQGAPVFDAAGRLIGIAAQRDGIIQLIALSALRSSLGAQAKQLGDEAESAVVTPSMQQGFDLSYETSLRHTLQVIVSGR